MNYKKWSVKVVITLIALFGVYYSVHAYSNNKVLKNYAQGYKKNPLGDHAKNKDGAVLTVYKAPLFQTVTNLSVSTEEVDLIIWIPLYGGDPYYGLIINDKEIKKSYQIETNAKLKASNAEEQTILTKKAESIDQIKAIVKEEWNIDL